MSLWPLCRSCLSPWSSFGIRYWIKKFLLLKYWNARLLPQGVPLRISIINSWAEPVPEGIEIELVKDSSTWEHYWEGHTYVSSSLVLGEPWVGRSSIRAEKAGFWGWCHRLRCYLLVTFDQRRRVLELHRRKGQPPCTHWEGHYLQPGLVLMNTLL